MVVDSLFNITVNVQAKSRVGDDFSGWTETWTTVQSDLPARIQPARGWEAVMHGRTQAVVTHVMYCRVVTMLPDYRVCQGAVEYDVVAVRDIDYVGEFLTVDLKEVRQ